MAEKKEKKNIEVKKKSAISSRMTEKAAIFQSSKNIYVFNVGTDASKKSLAAIIKSEYKVTPEKIRLLAVPKKNIFYRGKRGVKGGGKKAYVYLKKGDSITL